MTHSDHINPRILVWARETAGFSIDEAAKKLGLKDTAKNTAVDKLRAFESGERPTGRTTVQKAMALYRRPLIAFYMAQPPKRGDRGEDFRTTPGSLSARDNGTLDALLRDVRARQHMLRQVLDDEEEARPRRFVGSARVDHGASAVAASLRVVLGVTEEQQTQSKGPAGLFARLRAAAERIGVYVLLCGDVGSHHSAIGEDIFRGFALADDVAPFVVINDNDAVAARAFTLMHELAHIWVGGSGVSGPLSGTPENVIERFCNDVAGEFLLPPGAIADLSSLSSTDIGVVTDAVETLASKWNVSGPVVAYRLLREGRIDSAMAATLFKLFGERWSRHKQRAKDTRRADDAGPSYYVVRRHRLGPALLGVVRRALQGETLTHTRAAKILGVNPGSVATLLRERAQPA